MSGTSAVSVNQQYNYDAYGVGLALPESPQTSHLYTGEQWDSALKQYYLRARYYDPSNGRFNQLDPFAGSNFDPQSLHKYAYGYADPIGNIDPTGESALNVIIYLAAAVIVAAIGFWRIGKWNLASESTMGALEVRSNEVRIWIGHNYELRTIAVPYLRPKPNDSKDLFIACGGGESGAAIQGVADHDTSQSDPPFLESFSRFAIDQAIKDGLTLSPDGNTLRNYLTDVYGPDNPRQTWRQSRGSARSYYLNSTIAAARRKAAAIQSATGRQTNVRFILVPGYDIFVDGLYDVNNLTPIGEAELRLME